MDHRKSQEAVIAFFALLLPGGAVVTATLQFYGPIAATGAGLGTLLLILRLLWWFFKEPIPYSKSEEAFAKRISPQRPWVASLKLRLLFLVSGGLLLSAATNIYFNNLWRLKAAEASMICLQRTCPGCD